LGAKDAVKWLYIVRSLAKHVLTEKPDLSRKGA